MCSSNCCFLTCIWISQEVGQVVWYSHLLNKFPHFVVIHTVKGFGIVNNAEVDVFLGLSCFLIIPRMLAIWSLAPLPFLNPAWTSWSSRFTYCWSLAWRILSITLLVCEMSAMVGYLNILWHSLWDWNENWCFPIPSGLLTPVCLALGEWSHHCGYLGH